LYTTARAASARHTGRLKIGMERRPTRLVDIVVKGRHMEVRPDIKAYAEEKIGKVTRVLNGIVMSIEVELYHERNRSIDKGNVAEVTVRTKGHVIRAREASSDMKAAIDLVTEKLESQARRLKSKVKDRKALKGAPAPIAVTDEDDEDEEPRVIVKTKRVELKPMDAEEAIMQLELLGHDFFVFESAETEQVSVLYKRRDGNYGLITPAER
jgi:putative sigma-54 modulation protein